MAIDDAILTAVAAGEAPPTLRIYAWKFPGCLSLGYGQRAREVDQERLREHGIELVRRPTGGRAILHGYEVSYSLALPLDHPIAAGSILDSYRRISEALVAGFDFLKDYLIGEVRAACQPSDSPLAVACFEMSSPYEVTVGGRKLIGSAQVRRKGGMLQHGSMPVYRAVDEICDYLIYPDEAARAEAKARVRAHSINLDEAFTGDKHMTSNFPFGVLANGLPKVFNIKANEKSRHGSAAMLTPAELENVERLTREVYGNSAWTLRR
jgi:lipoate-protein ligase A